MKKILVWAGCLFGLCLTTWAQSPVVTPQQTVLTLQTVYTGTAENQTTRQKGTVTLTLFKDALGNVLVKGAFDQTQLFGVFTGITVPSEKPVENQLTATVVLNFQGVIQLGQAGSG
ncbi:hypothetical protein KKA14_06085, partial [bacterium]|nr:hypothetical protein [bacterium]